MRRLLTEVLREALGTKASISIAAAGYQATAEVLRSGTSTLMMNVPLQPLANPNNA